MNERLFHYYIPSHNHGGWGEFVLTSGGMFAAVSDYGNYAFAWRHHGEKDFRQFILGVRENWDYFATKFSGGQMDFDRESTVQAIEEYISSYLIDDAATAELELLEGGMYDKFEFGRWCEETTIPEPYEFYRDEIPYQLQLFCKELMPRLCDVIEKELENER